MVLRTMLITLIILFANTAQALGSNLNKSVTIIHSPDHRPCTFFQLEGVTEASPAVPNEPWFSVNINHDGHEVIVSILLTALTSGKKVDVITTGDVDCGFTQVSSVRILP
ncbi:hypothetical protein NBRC116591_07090 [Sessilibacter corallicola]|uniref:Secreted protein n=1 Tax=Sessilibacter corallicola TaxID=2904075 RepID=A0ABQ0A5H5_9GAMM